MFFAEKRSRVACTCFFWNSHDSPLQHSQPYVFVYMSTSFASCMPDVPGSRVCRVQQCGELSCSNTGDESGVAPSRPTATLFPTKLSHVGVASGATDRPRARARLATNTIISLNIERLRAEPRPGYTAGLGSAEPVYSPRFSPARGPQCLRMTSRGTA